MTARGCEVVTAYYNRRLRRPVSFLVLGVVLTIVAGCLRQPVPGQSGVGAVDNSRLSALWAPGQTIDSDLVRAPELFKASGMAKWTGQRTARGVWVAHPKARGTQRVRVVNPRTGREIDATLYRPAKSEGGDIVTVSSDTAQALSMRPGENESLAIFGLRPKGATSRTQRRTAESRAQGELASHISRMDETKLLQMVAAAMRGMGYATVFEPGPPQGAGSAVHAFPRPDAGFQLPAIRVVVRPTGKPEMSAEDVAKVQTWLTGSGDLGVLISVPGFSDSAQSGLTSEGAHIELVDLDGLLNIWLTHYERLSEPDRALLPLQPIYFLAAN